MQKAASGFAGGSNSFASLAPEQFSMRAEQFNAPAF